MKMRDVGYDKNRVWNNIYYVTTINVIFYIYLSLFSIIKMKNYNHEYTEYYKNLIYVSIISSVFYIFSMTYYTHNPFKTTKMIFTNVNLLLFIVYGYFISQVYQIPKNVDFVYKRDLINIMYYWIIMINSIVLYIIFINIVNIVYRKFILMKEN